MSQLGIAKPAAQPPQPRIAPQPAQQASPQEKLAELVRGGATQPRRTGSAG
ncbi:MAG: hypothetical protein K6F46_04250 [Desulfovibrio sp.]|nr:hypothetical protein [Desulfovibrio sp.]